MTIQLPHNVQTALDALNKQGYEAYVVGGCVRDFLLGKQPTDWDITTNAQPENVLEIFSGYKTVPTGIQHGTVTIIIDDMPLEITTYRLDGAYLDGRRPETVTFTSSLQEDLRRRDFTINAIAYHPTAGFTDTFSGMADLDAGRICCVGDPERRFTEDALRILRALRFSSVLGFSIDKITAQTIHRLAPLLRRISPERIAMELKKLLGGKNVQQVLLEFADVLCVVLPELQPMIGLRQDNPYHHLTVYEHTVETVASVENTSVLRLTMLFHDCGKPNCYTRDLMGLDHFRGHPAISVILAERAMNRLHLDKQTIRCVKTLIQHHDDTLRNDDGSLLRLLHRFGPEMAHQLVQVQRADVLGQHPDKLDRLHFLDDIDQRLTQLVQSGACYQLADLHITGDDLLQIGYPAGRVVGDTLLALLEEVMDGTCANEPIALQKHARERLKNIH